MLINITRFGKTTEFLWNSPGGESCLSQRAEHSLGWTAEGGRPHAVRGARKFVLLLPPLPLPIRFALPDAALFGYFLQRGLFVCLLFSHDFAHAMSYAHALGCGRGCSLFGFGDQERDFAFYVSSGFELSENLSRAPAQELFM